MKVIQRQVSFDSDQSSCSGGESTSKRKLLLHFDQHNTIQVACTLPGRILTVEEGLNNFLTSAVWGKEIDNKWVWVCNEPQIMRPANEPDAITYFKYLEKQIVRKPDDRVEFKRKTTKFIYNEPGIKFKEFFDLYLESLRHTEKELLTENKCEASTSKKNHLESNLCNTIPSGDPNNKSLYNLILPSFFDMIRRLQKSDREFTIILRTMGIDSQGFLDTVTPVLEGKHPDFEDIKPIKINRNLGSIKRYEKDKIKLFMDDEVYDTDQSIYDKLSSLTGINAIRDDFDYWQKNNYECYSAKPLWIDLCDTNHQHIIFDDNIRFDNFDDCIVNLRMKNNHKEHIYDNVNFNSYKLFESTNILQPNLIELLNPHLKKHSNKNNYCEMIKKSELVYNKFLENTILSNLQINFRPLKTQMNSDQLKESFRKNKANSMVVVPNDSFHDEITQEKNKIDNEDKIISRICMLQ